MLKLKNYQFWRPTFDPLSELSPITWPKKSGLTRNSCEVSVKDFQYFDTNR